MMQMILMAFILYLAFRRTIKSATKTIMKEGKRRTPSGTEYYRLDKNTLSNMRESLRKEFNNTRPSTPAGEIPEMLTIIGIEESIPLRFLMQKHYGRVDTQRELRWLATYGKEFKSGDDALDSTVRLFSDDSNIRFLIHLDADVRHEILHMFKTKISHYSISQEGQYVQWEKRLDTADQETIETLIAAMKRFAPFVMQRMNTLTGISMQRTNTLTGMSSMVTLDEIKKVRRHALQIFRLGLFFCFFVEIMPYQTLNPHALWLPAVIVSGIIMALFDRKEMLYRKIWTHATMKWPIAVSAISLVFSIYALLNILNSQLDMSPVKDHVAPIVGRYESMDGSSFEGFGELFAYIFFDKHYIVVQNWNAPDRYIDLRVDSMEYDDNKSRNLRVSTHPGLLGFEWISQHTMEDSIR